MTRVVRLDLRRAQQREALISSAEAIIANNGLGALKARDLAQRVGCSVGAIYNLVTDLDELVLLVSQRTMATLDTRLDAAGSNNETLEAQLLNWARAYHRYASTNRHRWRALFEFRSQSRRDLPAWFADDQTKLFVRLERRLASAMPGVDGSMLKRRARTLFSAVHGIVLIGLEQKLVAFPEEAIDDELAAFVRVYVAGLSTTRLDEAEPRTLP